MVDLKSISALWQKYGPKNTREWVWTVIFPIIVSLVGGGTWISNSMDGTETVPEGEVTEVEAKSSEEMSSSAATEPTKPEKRVILQREKTAGEIIDALRVYSDPEEAEKASDEIYEGRWIKAPGWTGTVMKLPSRVQTGVWSVDIEEQDSAAKIYAKSSLDSSSFRPGDLVQVVGMISNTNVPWSSVYVESASISLYVDPDLNSSTSNQKTATNAGPTESNRLAEQE